MAIYTTRNRLVKQATNENRNTWGTTLNGGLTDMVDEAMDGITALALTGNVTLTDEDGATDQARKRLINITSSDAHARVITIPAVEKWYIVENESAFRVNIKTASGAAAIVPGQCSAIVKCDGTDCFKLLQPDYGLISTTTTTSGTTHTFTLTGFGCTNFLLALQGVAGSTDLSISYSPDNSSYSSGVVIAAGSFSNIRGQYRIDLSNIVGATITGGVASVGSQPGIGDTTHKCLPTYEDDGVNYIRLTTSSAFSAGTVRLYGR